MLVKFVSFDKADDLLTFEVDGLPIDYKYDQLEFVSQKMRTRGTTIPEIDWVCVCCAEDPECFYKLAPREMLPSMIGCTYEEG